MATTATQYLGERRRLRTAKRIRVDNLTAPPSCPQSNEPRRTRSTTSQQEPAPLAANGGPPPEPMIRTAPALEEHVKPQEVARRGSKGWSGLTIPLPDKKASICQARGAVAGRMASLEVAGVLLADAAQAGGKEGERSSPGVGNPGGLERAVGVAGGSGRRAVHARPQQDGAQGDMRSRSDGSVG